MAYQIRIETVAARPLAAVRRKARVGQIGQVAMPALDQVWAFLRRNPGLRTDGDNIFLYRHPDRRDEPMTVDFGVEVAATFAPVGEIIASATPSGEVATTLYVGPYSGIGAAHDALHRWREAAGREFAGWSWEIYGDWTADESKLETQILYLLR